MESNRLNSSTTPHAPGLLAMVTDVEIEAALVDMLTDLLKHPVDVTIMDTSRSRLGAGISFDVTGSNNPVAAQGLRELCDMHLAAAISGALGQLTSQQLQTTIHRRRYGYSSFPGKSILQPVRITVHVEETRRAKTDEHRGYAVSL